MKQYTDTELTSKIHTFLGERFEKFPSLASYGTKQARKNRAKSRRDSGIFTTLENLNSLWAQRIHS